MKVSFFKQGLFLLLIVVYSPPAFAQVTGTIVGAVKDQSGAIIPSAPVTVLNIDTGIRTSSKTGDTGFYSIPQLPVGNYAITVEHAGFKQTTITGIKLDVDQTIRVDITLEIGEVTQKVEVVSAAPLIQTEDATLSSVIDNRRVVDLPLNGRSFLSLTQLTVGTTPGMPNTTINGEFQGGGQVSANGQRSSSGNNFTLDGVNNTALVGRWASVRPSIDAIQEFAMETGQYAASKGNAAGAQVNLALKSGTNDWHATVFEFLRNDNLDANNFFRNRSGLKKSEFKRNQFGVVASGPIIRNRTFWLFNYEGLRLPEPATATGIMPTPEQLQGNFSGFSGAIIDPATGKPFPGNIIPDSRIDHASKNLTQFWPAPNANQPGYNYIATGSNRQNFDNFIGKIDHDFSQSDKIRGHYAVVQRDQNLLPLINFFETTTTLRAQNFGLNYTHTFNPTLLLDLRFGFFRENSRSAFPTRDPAIFSGTALGIPLATDNPSTVGVPLIGINGFTGIGDQAFRPYYSADNVFQYTGNITRIKGRHNMSFGAEFIREQQNGFVEFYSRGQFTFDGRFTKSPGASPFPENALADFLLGYPAQVFSGSGSIPDYQRSNVWSLYVQDNFKFRPNLTFNLGLRYEVHTIPVDIRGYAVNFDPATGKLFGGGTPNAKMADTDYNNLGPRVGFAWQPFGSTKTVIRGGGGVFYDHVEHNQWTILSSMPPTFFSTDVVNDFSNPFLISDPIKPTLSGLPFLIPVNFHIRTAYTQQWSLNVQRELATNLEVELGYVGPSSHKLGGWYDLNAAPPGPGDVQARRPYQDYTAIYFWDGDTNANYNALQLQVRKRYSNGLTLLSAYTWSKTIDGGSFSTGNGGFGGNANYPANPFNRAAEKSLSKFHTPNRWVTSLIWDLPGKDKKGLAGKVIGGWQFSTITVLQSGYPIAINILNDSANIGGFDERPNINGNPNLSEGQRTLDRFFNTSVFSQPADYTFGNAGRNIVESDGIVNFDVGLMKVFKITERHQVQFRAEFFNAFNHVTFGSPGTYLGAGDFGVVSSQYNIPRQIQFGLKYSF